MTEKTLLVENAGVIMSEHRKRLSARSYKGVAKLVVNHTPCPALQRADTLIPSQPAVVQQGNPRSEESAQRHGQPTTGVFDTGKYKGHARASPEQEWQN